MRVAATRLAANSSHRGFGDQLYDLSGQVPSLDLNFSNTKSLTDSASGQQLVTFTRASSGTYVDSQGVIRTATTNLLEQSEALNLSPWSGARSSVAADVLVAPNGTVTADKLVEDSSASSTHQRGNSKSCQIGKQYTLSAYAKAGERSQVQLLIQSAPFGIAQNGLFDLLTQSVVSTSGGASASITNVGAGWYRLAITTIAATSTASANLLFLLATGGLTVYTGDGTSGIYLWGAQLEESSTVGEYIPTTSTINSAPRFDHNPTTGESLGLLVEEQRTNLQTQSEAFDQSPWSTVGGTTSTNVIAAPDSTTTADLLTENTTTGQHDIRATSPSLTDAVSYTFSVFAKTNGRLLQIIFPITASGHGGIFNLTAGTVTVVGTVTATIQAFPNGWYRCIVSGVKSGTGAVTIRLLTHNGTGNSYTGDGTSGIYLWGAQLEAASFPTSYIPTTTATVTRSADVASITGSNWSSWGSSTTGTYYLEASVTRSSASAAKVFLGTSTSPAESYYLYQVQNQNDLRTFDSTTVLDTVNVISDGITFKGGIAYSSADSMRSLVLDGGAVVEGAFDGTYGTDLSIGSRIAGGAPTTGTIRRLTYWPARLPNETLQTITQ